MARPIEPTPILEGRDAEKFLDSVKVTAPMPEDRSRWMDDLARQSKAVERPRTGN